MNTLQDLRATLDQHAHDVSDDAPLARVSAVRGRARRVRQRRTGAVVVGAALAVVGAVLVPTLGEQPPAPAGSPETMTSLGWTYERASTESGTDRVVVRVAAAETPRLVSWGTPDGDQRVAVKEAGSRPRSSVDADWEDFAWVPPGSSTRVALERASGGRLDVAVYELDRSVTPEGIGEGLRTFREDVAGMVLLGAALGEPGTASVEVEVTPTQRTVWVATTCDDLPEGYRVHVGWTDEEGSLSSGSCDSGSSFDPGGSPNSGFPAGEHAGRSSTLRIWLTRGEDRPVADGELPDVRLGLGAYTYDDVPFRIAGTPVPWQREHDGRVWTYLMGGNSEVSRNGRLPFLIAPEEREESGPFAVVDAVRGRGTLRYALTVDGRTVGSSTTFVGTGGGGSGDLVPVEPGSRVSLRVGTPLERLDEAGIALYRRED